MPTSAAFQRSFASLSEIFALTADTFAREGIDARLLHTVDLALEELFTNMVKYSRASDAAVHVSIVPIAEGVEVTLTDYDVEPFDVTNTPDIDITLPDGIKVGIGDYHGKILCLAFILTT